MTAPEQLLQVVSRPIDALRHHWPEYLFEAVGLGIFMISAGTFTTLLEYSGSSIRGAIEDPWARRALIGLAMGATSVGLIYSPWGARSGAHLNPAVTLTFYRLGKVGPWDGIFYVGAQFLGGLTGVLLVHAALGQAFAQSPVILPSRFQDRLAHGSLFWHEHESGAHLCDCSSEWCTGWSLALLCRAAARHVAGGQSLSPGYRPSSRPVRQA